MVPEIHHHGSNSEFIVKKGGITDFKWHIFTRYLNVFWEYGYGQFRRAKSSWNERKWTIFSSCLDPFLEPRSFQIFDDLFASKRHAVRTQSPSPKPIWPPGDEVLPGKMLSLEGVQIVFMSFQTRFFGGFDWHQLKKREKSFKEHMCIELYLGSCQCSKHCNTWRKLRLGFPS